MKKTLIIATLALASSAAYAQSPQRGAFQSVDSLITMRDLPTNTSKQAMQKAIMYGYIAGSVDAIASGDDGSCGMPDMDLEKMTDLVVSGLKEERAFFTVHPIKDAPKFGDLDAALAIQIVLSHLYPCKK